MSTTANYPDRYAVIGYPVKHSFSPFIHGMFAKQTKQNLVYRLMEVKPEDLEPEVVRFFIDHGKGLNVTIPHKQTAFALCKQRSPRAERAGAINTLLVQSGGDLFGDNTDGVGLVNDLTKNLKFSLNEKRILLLGAGGAARGVLSPLLEQKPKLIHILNRDAQKAQTLAEEFKDMGELVGDGFEATDGEPYDLIINATAASLQGVMPPVPTSAVARKTLCYDMAYGKEDTPFTRWAKQHRASAELGWGMLVEQAAESFYLWRGVRPDTAPVLEAVRSPPPQRAMQ
ncbi:MAG TPA: shikimate dehydrogenase [Steroidobacteraceae bacterium]|nr:shikimate dehydrogenase [Steroidobacteraceae bacterium]